ncbi:hypothetical protein B0T19DRAFT_468650 [Cercophora scortea]|uniref:Uncharacterized protein n=1 Tax=Cercophora scortea TaxID=314031 RepID=A0AAE0I846_9PEZI|nr:hypothetical protein B0T19DRAFT_468650 [Cercophora scortea]
MSLLDARDIIPFPPGNNASDTVFGGVHFNLTILKEWNYTYFENRTLSNGTWCVLPFAPYTPALLLENGTFVNVTWCWHPVNQIGVRGGTGLGFATLFGVGLVLTLIALSKHGKLHLPAERRFWPIGRRWQWYWAIFTCAMALISLLTNIDVDRYYLPELPIVLTSFFWFLMQLGAMAIVWEAVRHWGSWMERQFIDPNPFVLKLDDRRAKIEFFIPLFFYFWIWMNFFLVVPRSWTGIEMQRYPQQIIDVAIPAATDGRFKAAAFCLVVCWLTIAFSLRHSIKHYRERNRGFVNRLIGLIRFTPLRFILLMPLSLAIPAYQALCAWEFQWSPLNVKGLTAAIYVGGYLPSLLIVYIQAITGFINPNEDLELQRQRRVRGAEINRELGIATKPAWWRRANSEFNPNERMRDRIARNVRELGGGKATASNLEAAVDTRLRENENTSRPVGGEDVEMNAMPRLASTQASDLLGPVSPGDFAGARAVASRYAGKSEQRRTENAVQVAAGLLFPGASEDPVAAAHRRAELMMDGPPPSVPPPPYVASARGRPSTVGAESNTRSTIAERSNSTNTANSINSPPQQIRSMLDI